MTEWIISANPKNYDVIGAFYKFKKIDREMTANFEIGDIVYIYVTGDVKSLRFRCRVSKIGFSTKDIDDQEFIVSGSDDKINAHYMELSLLEEFIGPAYTRTELIKYGFISPQGPIKMPESVKQYISTINSTQSKRYTVNQAIWLGAAALAFEKHANNPDAPEEEYYFRQADIQKRAQTFTSDTVDSARCSWWCCADQKKSTNNYLRGDHPSDKTLRRLTRIDEFPEKTHPLDLDMDAVIELNGESKTIGELFSFVQNQYPEELRLTTNIDYIGILQYLQENHGQKYSNPEKVTGEERNRYLALREKGQAAVTEMKKIEASGIMVEAWHHKFKITY